VFTSLAVVGSRSLDDDEHARAVGMSIIEEALRRNESLTTFVSGGAKGPDKWGETLALEKTTLDLILHKPDWDEHGRRAGFVRNEYIVRDADVVMAFWDGKSRGTQHDLELCKKTGTPCVLYTWNPASKQYSRKRIV